MNTDYYTDYKGTLIGLVIVILLFCFIGYVFLPIIENEPYLLSVIVMVLPILALGLKYWLRNSEDKYNLLKGQNWINFGLLCCFFSFALCEKIDVFLMQKLEYQVLIKNVDNLILLIYYLTCISVYFTGIILKKNNEKSEVIEVDKDLNILQIGAAVILIILLMFPVPHWCSDTIRFIVCGIFIQQVRVANRSNFITQVITYIGLVFLFNPIKYFVFEYFTWQIIFVSTCLFLIISILVNRRNEKRNEEVRYMNYLRKKYKNEAN